MMNEDEKRIEEIREREKRASPGPWGYWEYVAAGDSYHGKNDHLFMAHAREDIPWLLSKITTLNTRVKELEKELKDWKECVIAAVENGDLDWLLGLSAQAQLELMLKASTPPSGKE